MDAELYKLFSIINYAVCDKQPPEITACNWQRLYTISKSHNIINIVYNGLQKLKIELPSEIKAKFDDANIKSVFRKVQQDIETQQIISALVENKIRCMPLKGLILKNIYPEPNIRMMSDADILVDESNLARIHELMLDFGYSFDHYDENHDVYTKPPFMAVEFHRALIGKNTNADLFDYMGTWNRAKLIDGSQFIFELSNEDFYIYMIGHIAKHFYIGGCGIRNIIDIKIYLDRYKKQLNWSYIDSELEKCGLLKFAQHFEKLSEIWFLNIESSVFYDKLTGYLVNSGTYGSQQHYATHRVVKSMNKHSFIKAKINRIFTIIFPGLEHMKILYPWLEEYGYLLPLCWTLRIIRVILSPKHRNNLKVLFNVARIQESSADFLMSIYNELGLCSSTK